MKSLNNFILFTLFCLLSSCSGDNPTPKNDNTVLGDVYISGYVIQNNIPIATYWKNKEAVYLTDGSQPANANSVWVNQSDVYVAGYVSNGTNNVATYWKNGTPSSLANGTSSSSAKAVVVSDGNVYIAGTMIVRNDNNILQQAAFVWKNDLAE